MDPYDVITTLEGVGIVYLGSKYWEIQRLHHDRIKTPTAVSDSLQRYWDEFDQASMVRKIALEFTRFPTFAGIRHTLDDALEYWIFN